MAYRIKRQPILPVGPSIAYIELTQGHYTLVDSDDIPFLRQWNWTLSIGKSWKRAYRKEGKTSVFLYTALMNTPLGMVVDHRNRNPLDNRRSNLRICTQRVNAANSSKITLGAPGIVWHKRDKRFQVSLYVNKKVHHLGYFKEFDEAVRIRFSAEQELLPTE